MHFYASKNLLTELKLCNQKNDSFSAPLPIYQYSFECIETNFVQTETFTFSDLNKQKLFNMSDQEKTDKENWRKNLLSKSSNDEASSREEKVNKLLEHLL